MITYDRPADLTAFEAISEAQKLAFSPIAFQAAVALERLGILRAIEEAGEDGAHPSELARRFDLAEYGVRVLVDMGLSIGLLWRRGERYVLDKMGYFVLNDPMTKVNLAFVADFCYSAMNRLQDSVLAGVPLGLERFGSWPTLYPGLASLPEPARGSWFAFDQFYSARAFDAALALVLAHGPSHILDIGGNTGLWALACVQRDTAVRVTIVDLPQQTRIARNQLHGSPFLTRIGFHDTDLLDPQRRSLPSGADTIWMSQFLDCFSEPQIVDILRTARDALDDAGSLFVLELLSDRQQHAAAAYSVNATSLYFTCIANGVSRMYRSDDLLRMIELAGLRVRAQHDNLGIGHTLLHCVKARSGAT
jgi:hypothetical protein